MKHVLWIRKEMKQTLTTILLLSALCTPLAFSANAMADKVQVMSNAEITQRGIALKAALTEKYKELWSNQKFEHANGPGIEVDDVYLKYIPLGTSFRDAYAILKAADASLGDFPPRPSAPVFGDKARYDLLGHIVLESALFGSVTCNIDLVPDTPGATNPTVKALHSGVFINTL